MRSVRIRSFSGPYFPKFGLNTEFYFVNLRIQDECGRIRVRKTPNTEIFHAMCSPLVNIESIENHWHKTVQDKWRKENTNKCNQINDIIGTTFKWDELNDKQ